jgi:hypothetical protein
MNRRLLILVLIPLFAFTLHKEYFSLTKIDYNKKEQTVQITMRLFTDDMELALLNQFKKPTELGTKIEVTDANKLLNIYLNQRFRININSHKTSYNFIGKEFEKDVVYVYLEIPNIKNINQIEIQNGVLTDTFSEQENIVKVNYLDQQKSLILTKQNDRGILKFQQQ